ncbi:MAG: RagB/SusD family nutrient uptake outer membrane protein [Mangrovibacterium sp.]
MRNTRYKILALMLAVAYTFTGCNNYLDVVPEEDLTSIENIFEKRSTAIQFFYGCYQFYNRGGNISSDPSIAASDEITTSEYLRNSSLSGYSYRVGFRIAQGLQSTPDPILPTWGGGSEQNYYIAIRNCNTFLDNIDNVNNMEDDEISQYKASAKAIKAFYYFELMKRYGPICLVPQNIGIEESIEAMQIARSPIDECVDAIIRLFDEALDGDEYGDGIVSFAEQSQTEYGFLTREAVMGYKAKVLLYAASPLFNGNYDFYSDFKNRLGVQLFNLDEDAEKWKKAADAAKEAIEFCEGTGLVMYSGYSGESSPLLNKIRDLQYAVLPETFDTPGLIHGTFIGNPSSNMLDIYARLPRYNSQDANFSSSVLGNINPTLRMVEMYYTENGLPFDDDKTRVSLSEAERTFGIERSNTYNNVVALNENVLELHLRREPRFYANIAFDKGIWKRLNDYVEMEPYRNGRHGVETLNIKNNTYYNITGYWQKKLISEKNRGTANYNFSVVGPFLRLRLADLYLMYAEALNEYYGPTEEVYEAINKVRERAGIPTVQDSWNNYSNNPSKITTKKGMRDIIQRERMIELAFEGQRFWDLRRWKIAEEYLDKPARGWNILGDESNTFYNMQRGPIEVWKDNEFRSPRDYFWPIKDEEIFKSLVVQNPGW